MKIFALAVLALLSATFAALANHTATAPIVTYCGQDYARVAEALAQQYGEALLLSAVSTQGDSVELWASFDNGTGTLITRGVDGTACVIYGLEGLATAASAAPAGELH